MIELLVGLAIIAVLLAALAPLWLALERAGAGDSDLTVCFVQGRVAVARLERDLRLAGAAGSSFPTTCALLQAGPKQVVFLERAAGGPPSLIEWEIVGGALMRRTGRCPAGPPAAFAHSLYTDSKTMLERLSGESRFAYQVNGTECAGPLGEEDLGLVDSVLMTLKVGAPSGVGAVCIGSKARVAR